MNIFIPLLAVSLSVCVHGGIIQQGEGSSKARDLVSRIVGGEPATENEFPHQVSLQVGSHRCGAVIISEEWVVTAAHCVDGIQASTIKIEAGILKLSEGGTVKNVDSFVTHPDWDPIGDGFPNDVAVVKLSSAFEFSDAINKIEMADSDDGNFAGVKCTISGWGKTSGGGIGLPDDLQKVDMTVLTKSDCIQRWSTITGATVNNGHICIGDTAETDSSSACNGDSGGPMTCTEGGNTYLAGVTSWGISNCISYPSVYTRISFFRDWIKQETGI